MSVLTAILIRATRSCSTILFWLVCLSAYGQSTDWIAVFHEGISADSKISDPARKRTSELIEATLHEDVAAVQKDLAAVIPAFKDGNEQVRLSASGVFSVVSQFRQDSAEALKPSLPILLSLVRDKNAMVRGNIFRALGYMHPKIPPEVVSVLRGFVRDPDENARGWAMFAIAQNFRPDSEDQKLLESLLSDPHAPIRQTAVEALGIAMVHDSTMIAILRQRLSDPDTGVVRAAIRACDEIGPPAVSAKDDLQKIVDANVDSELSRQAAGAIRRITAPPPPR